MAAMSAGITSGCSGVHPRPARYLMAAFFLQISCLAALALAAAWIAGLADCWAAALVPKGLGTPRKLQTVIGVPVVWACAGGGKSIACTSAMASPATHARQRMESVVRPRWRRHAGSLIR